MSINTIYNRDGGWVNVFILARVSVAMMVASCKSSDCKLATSARCYPCHMQTHQGYFTDAMQSQPWYRCLMCKYDCFSKSGIQQHVRWSHLEQVLPEDSLPIEDWHGKMLAGNAVRGLEIGISLLTWNTKDASVEAALAISREVCQLDNLGAIPHVYWVDNGSSDGTQDDVLQVFHDSGVMNYVYATINPANLGQCRARNQILRLAQQDDYLLMVDGDVQIVPYSAFAMARYLQTAPASVGCVGVYCRNCTPTPDDEVARSMRRIDDWMVDADPLIAWTNYGMFRQSVISQCRFEESGPFAGPGWGFEDDDFQMQMTVAGLTSVNTKYFRHVHRTRHSSVRLLGQSLAAKVHGERKAYLIRKWEGVPAVEEHLRLLRNQTMPVVDAV